MADEEFKADLAKLLSKHGVAGVSAERAKAPGLAQPGGAAASYIKEIITGDQSFDEATLDRVVGVLRRK